MFRSPGQLKPEMIGSAHLHRRFLATRKNALRGMILELSLVGGHCLEARRSLAADGGSAEWER
jgi:hypothetical protein